MNRFLQQLDDFAEALRDQSERSKLWLLCGFSIFYLISTSLIAARKLMWNDELFTFYISRLPTLSEMWSAVVTGADQSAPFFFMITRASLWLFGENHLATRLPEVLGFWLMSLCLFRFVAKRSSALHGFTAMLFPLVTTAYNYAYEARPYGLVLGFSALSLLCWQSAADGRYRKLPLVGLALSSAAAVSNHYYAVLLLFPLALGEVVRSVSRRRIDWPVWIAFGIAVTPLLVFIPVIEAAKTYTAHFWAQAYWKSLPESYYFLLKPSLLPLVAVVIFAAVYSTTHSVIPNSPHQRSCLTPSLHEIVAAFGFITIPIVAMIVGKVVTGVFTHRYVLLSVIGFSILIAFAAYRLLDRRTIMGAVLLLSLFGGFAVLVVRNVQEANEVSIRQAKTDRFLRFHSENGLPIVASDAHTFMKLTYYSPRDIASRLVYLADPELSLRHFGYTTVDRQMLELKPWFRLRIEPYGPYVASHRRFFVYGDIGWLNWVVYELTASDMQVELKGRNEDNLLFLVSAKESR
jgi:Dolichyl-phosphate-mannose-protein mannosyltransferase